MSLEPAPLPSVPYESRLRSAGKWLVTAAAPFFSLVLVALFFHFYAPDQPFTQFDLRTVSIHTIITGICALGMTLIIISGGIDLSVGSAIALSSVTAALALQKGASLPIAALIAIATGAACGLYNGILITLLRLPPFIATLGTLGFYRGLAKRISDSMPVSAPTHGLETWVQPTPEPEWLLVAPGVWLTLVLVIVFVALLRYSILGRYATAIGSNEATARLCGIRVARTKVYIYVVAGLLTGLAGLLQFARLTQGDPTVAVGKELDVIAAVVIGGGSLTGGQASMIGTLVGAFLMAFLNNRCAAVGWPNYVQEMIVGHIIIIAVALDQWRMRRMAN